MRSTLAKLCVLSAFMTPGCGKDSPSETTANQTTTGADETTGAGQSESGLGSVTGASDSAQPTTGPQTTTMTSATTTGAETSAGETAMPGTEGNTFLVMPDGGAGGVKECSNWDQDCPEDQKCMPWADNGSTAWNATKCVPVDPAKDQPGDSCTVEGSAVSGLDSCDLGVLCWDVKADTMTGTCVAQCKGPESAPTCSSDTSCFISNDGVLNLCLPKCDPLTQDCPNENLCIPNPQNPEEFTCVLDASGDNGQTFNPCEYINACDKGFYCAAPSSGSECDAAATGCCLPFCDLSDMPMCPGENQECVAWYEMGAAPPGLENVGLCSLP